MTVPQGAWRDRLESAYDCYFSSRYYDERYPQPNPSTLAFLWRHGAAQARQVLDFGCGNGRYAMPVLQRSDCQLAGCDISRAAMAAFSARLQDHPARHRVTLVLGAADALPPHPRFDCILMLFGVLSHVGPREARIATLQALRSCAADDRAVLLLSVPSVWRRMPAAVLRSAWRVLWRQRASAWNDVMYRRDISGRDVTFFYHLYGLREMRRELHEGGWNLLEVEAESVLPERWVCRFSWAARIDGWLQALVPAWFGYGLRAVARPRTDDRG